MQGDLYSMEKLSQSIVNERLEFAKHQRMVKEALAAREEEEKVEEQHGHKVQHHRILSLFGRS